MLSMMLVEMKSKASSLLLLQNEVLAYEAHMRLSKTAHRWLQTLVLFLPPLTPFILDFSPARGTSSSEEDMT